MEVVYMFTYTGIFLGVLGFYFRHISNRYMESKKGEEAKIKYLMNKQVGETLRNKEQCNCSLIPSGIHQHAGAVCSVGNISDALRLLFHQS